MLHTKSSNIGGQAVMEGVMMKNKDRYAIAVRKPDHEIEVMTDTCKSIVSNKKLTETPFVRGIFNFIDSLVLGMKAISYSAEFYLDEEEETDPKKTSGEKQEKAENKNKENEKKKNDTIMAVTMVVAVVLALGLFVGLPFLASEFLRRFVTKNEWIVVTCEGLIRLGLFIGYVALISQMKEIKRVYMYHGAEHKCINCIENGLELNVENVRKSSRQHKRCGTSFLLFVMLISIIIGFLIRCGNPWLRLVLRLLMIPVVAGIAYELIKLAGNSDNPVVGFVSKPGLWLQRLTTKEPDDDMIQVGIKSVEAVFDWREYFRENQIPFSDDSNEGDEQEKEEQP